MSKRRHRVERHPHEEGHDHPSGGAAGRPLLPLPAASPHRQHQAAQQGHGRQVAGEPGGEAGEVGDDEPGVGAPEGEQDAGMVGPLPGRLGRLAVAEEGVEQAAHQHAHLHQV